MSNSNITQNQEDVMKKTYKSPALIDQGTATARTLQEPGPAVEPETGLEDKIGTL